MTLHRFFIDTSKGAYWHTAYFKAYDVVISPVVLSIFLYCLGWTGLVGAANDARSAVSAVVKNRQGPLVNANQSAGMRGQSVEKGDIGTLFINGNDVHVVLEGQKVHDNKINLNTNAKIQMGKKKTSLKVESQDDQALKGTILVPQGMRVVIEGGSVTVNVQGFIGDLTVNSGTALVSGQGKLSRFTLVSGVAKVKLQGLMGQTQIHCGDGDIHMDFIHESYENINDLVIPAETNPPGENKYISSGLRLHYPAVKITVNLAKGQAVVVFPKDLGVYYPKECRNFKSLSVRHQSKRAPYRIFPYISGAASLTLRGSEVSSGGKV